MKVTFIGLGQMGKPMASNILKGGHAVSVFDINQDAVNELVGLGATTNPDLTQVAKDSDIVVTMLPNGALVKQTLENGIFNHVKPNTLFIDMSTIHPLESDNLRKVANDLGYRFIDAPVGRTSDHAIAGNLLILAGGETADIEYAMPIFDCMGETLNIGGAGKGIRIKIINNYMSIALNALSAETMAMAEQLGLTFDEVMPVFDGTPAGKGHFHTTWTNKVLKDDLSPTFMVDLAHKDLGIAIELANQIGTTLPMGAMAREMYNLAKINGHGRHDWTAILTQYRDMAKK